MNQKREASFVFLAEKVSFSKDSNSRDGIFFPRWGMDFDRYRFTCKIEMVRWKMPCSSRVSNNIVLEGTTFLDKSHIQIFSVGRQK